MLVVPNSIAAPASFAVEFSAPALGTDLTLVTAVQAQMLRSDGTQTTLTLQIISATTSTLLAQYTFAGGEITTNGIYYLAPSLTVPGGFIPAETVVMLVKNPFTKGTPNLSTESWVESTALVASQVYVPSWFAAAVTTPVVQSLTLPVYPGQFIGVDSSTATPNSITISANPAMVLGQFFQVEDWGNSCGSIPYTISGGGTLIQNPHSMQISGTTYQMGGVNDSSGAVHAWRLVHAGSPAQTYLKAIR